MHCLLLTFFILLEYWYELCNLNDVVPIIFMLFQTQNLLISKPKYLDNDFTSQQQIVLSPQPRWYEFSFYSNPCTSSQAFTNANIIDNCMEYQFIWCDKFSTSPPSKKFFNDDSANSNKIVTSSSPLSSKATMLYQQPLRRHQ